MPQQEALRVSWLRLLLLCVLASLTPENALTVKRSQKTPPTYDLANIHVPTALYYGGHDDLADLTDVQVSEGDATACGLLCTSLIVFPASIIVFPDFDQ